MEKNPAKIDSKFRFVLVAAHRAEQLMRGARPRVDAAAKKLTRIAQQEVERDLVFWDYQPPPVPEAEEGEEPEVLEAVEEEEVH